MVATVGDINALPDFYGTLADAQNVASPVLQATLQVIRREAYMTLENIRMKLAGEYDFKLGKSVEWGRAVVGKGAWSGAAGVTAETWGSSVPRRWPTSPHRTTDPRNHHGRNGHVRGHVLPSHPGPQRLPFPARVLAALERAP
ncbi:MAG: hypothetical protein ACOYEV_11355 [Candidatus Nanopelagicales bacterium]